MLQQWEVHFYKTNCFCVVTECCCVSNNNTRAYKYTGKALVGNRRDPAPPSTVGARWLMKSGSLEQLDTSKLESEN